MRIVLSICLLVSLVTFASCDLGNIDDPNYQNNSRFIPLEVGRYVTYDVKQTTTVELPDEGEDRQQVELYQLKEQIGDVYTDLRGTEVYELQRFKRLSEDDIWQIDSVWSVKVEEGKVIRSEKGVPIVSLLIPAKRGLEWDANIYNAKSPLMFSIENAPSKYALEEHTFEYAVEVFTGDTAVQTGTGARYYEQYIYADTVGLVYAKRVGEHVYDEIFTFSTSQLTKNPFCQHNMAQVINPHLPTGLVPNPFYDDGSLNCFSNPIQGMDSAQVVNWLKQYEGYADTSDVHRENGVVVDISVWFYNPNYNPDSVARGVEYEQVVSGFGKENLE